VQPSGLLCEDLTKPLRPEPESLGAEMCEFLLGSLRREQPDTRALLRASLGQDESAAALEPRCVSGQEAGPVGRKRSRATFVLLSPGLAPWPPRTARDGSPGSYL